jgi:hypothetical protein
LLLFWLEIVIVIAGTFLSPVAQTLGVKLLVITTVAWLVKGAFRRYIVRGRKALAPTIALTILFVVAVLGLVVFDVKEGHLPNAVSRLNGGSVFVVLSKLAEENGDAFLID